MTIQNMAILRRTIRSCGYSGSRFLKVDKRKKNIYSNTLHLVADLFTPDYLAVGSGRRKLKANEADPPRAASLEGGQPHPLWDFVYKIPQ